MEVDMEDEEVREVLVARCIVCRGNIFSGDVHEIWQDAYYCRQHSLPYLRERAREYADILARGDVPDRA
jgi:hypothetical protein